MVYLFDVARLTRWVFFHTRKVFSFKEVNTSKIRKEPLINTEWHNLYYKKNQSKNHKTLTFTIIPHIESKLGVQRALGFQK